MTKTAALVAILVVAVISGAVDGWCEAVSYKQGALFILVPLILNLLLIFQWLHVDSDEHKYIRSQALNMAVIFVGFIAIPVYLYKSRLPGTRLKAIGVYAALVVVWFGADVLSTYAAYTLVAP